MTLPPLAAETLTTLASLPITNSYVNSLLTVLGFIIVGFLFKKILNRTGDDSVPKGLLNLGESILELILSYMDRVTHDHKKSLQFLPIVGSLFLFILVSNWVGLFPGIGSIGVYQMHHGNPHLIPIFRPANTDLNMTLAMAVLAVISSHVLGVAAIGFFKYVNKFIKFGDLYHALISLNPVKILTAIIEFLVGFIEIFSEVAKIVSLSLRLFGNVFAGEVLLTVLAGLIAIIVPLPFMALEILVSLIQAMVFSLLTLVYLTVATAEIHGHNDKPTYAEATTG